MMCHRCRKAIAINEVFAEVQKPSGRERKIVATSYHVKYRRTCFGVHGIDWVGD